MNLITDKQWIAWEFTEHQIKNYIDDKCINNIINGVRHPTTLRIWIHVENQLYMEIREHIDELIHIDELVDEY